MRRLCLLVMCVCLVLVACRPLTSTREGASPGAQAWRPLSTVTPSVPAPTPPAVAEASPALTPLAGVSPGAPPAASPAGQVYIPRLSTGVTETPTPTLSPTITLTPQPTNTPLPTNTPGPEIAVTIERPVADEFVAATITASGSVTNATGGGVMLSIRTPDGQVVGPDAVAAEATLMGGLLQFSGKVPVSLPPTPRQAVLIARYEPGDGSPAVEAGQAINLQGRYGHIDRLVVEQPKPLEQASAGSFDVRGVVSGPPAKVLVRLLDAADNLLVQVEASLAWYQPGLPCDYAAQVADLPEATQLQVLSMAADDTVLEATRVRLR